MHQREAMAYLDLEAADILAKMAASEWSFDETHRERKLLDVLKALAPPDGGTPMSGLAFSRMQAEVLHLLCAARIAGDIEKAIRCAMIAGSIAPAAHLERLVHRTRGG